MDNSNNPIQQTKNYDQFKFLRTNRKVNKPHIQNVIKAIEENPHMLAVQPILVNENFEIIDGQHRFLALKELNLPIYYIIMEGLQIGDARLLNISHRGWKIQDYADSYAKQGDANYQRFNKLREDYDINFNVALVYAKGSDTRGLFADFRHGEFTFSEAEDTLARKRLDILFELLGYVDPAIKKEFRTFGEALIRLLSRTDYSHRHFMKRMKERGAIIRRQPTTQEYLRQFEELYNWGLYDKNRIHLWA